MATFASVHSYWEFAASVRSRRRYIRDAAQSAFLEALLALSESKREVVAGGTILYRAQLGCDWPTPDEEAGGDAGPRGFSPVRMKPQPHRASDGRVNARGIPCLYTATQSDTAAAEVRPWIGAYVSVAQLKTSRALHIVNCTSDDQRSMIYFSEPDPAEREVAVWRDIDRAFAQPVERDEHDAEYAPTQVIAEMFRDVGLDGIAYRSALGPGHNLALFDVDAADVINCTVHQVRGIHLDLPEVANRYFVTEHYPKLRRPDT